MKKCEICNKEIKSGSPFNTERTHGQCVQNEFRDLLNKELEKQCKSVANDESNWNMLL